MSKTDITITRMMKVNTHEIHNFTFVEPTVSVTLKDVDVADVAKKTDLLSDLVTNMLIIEAGKAIDQISIISRVTPAAFVEALKSGKMGTYESRVEKITKELAE